MFNIQRFIDSIHLKVKAGILGGAIVTAVLTVLQAVDVSHSPGWVGALVGVVVSALAGYLKSEG